MHDYVRAARLLRAQWHFARGEPSAALTEIDGLLEDIGYPSARVANRLPSILTLKARAELALGRGAAALRNRGQRSRDCRSHVARGAKQRVRRRRADGARGDTARARRFRERLPPRSALRKRLRPRWALITPRRRPHCGFVDLASAPLSRLPKQSIAPATTAAGPGRGRIAHAPAASAKSTRSPLPITVATFTVRFRLQG